MEVRRSELLDGLGSIVADLISDNLAAHPERERLLTGALWAASISVPEAESEFRLVIGDRSVAVDVESASRPALAITADGDTLIALPEVPLVAGLPSPFVPSGRELIAKLLTGRLKIGGLVRHPIKVTRILRLLNTSGPA